jgi:gamma-glutamylcyclotransferase (GGCT)/AIG2-like uncharacterized protein YtfP
MKDPGPRLFVYGTLMSGCENQGLLRGLGGWRARARGRLYRLEAGYPAMVVEGEGLGWVQGELVELDNPGRLLVLDSFEGVHEGLYSREVIRVAFEGRSAECWAYVMRPDHPRLRNAARLKGGDWRRYRWGRSG